LGVGAASSASAQPGERTVTRTTVERHTVARGHRGWTTRRVCRTQWYHHRKVRRCRTIRVRRG
jgi:hypothetical protein